MTEEDYSGYPFPYDFEKAKKEVRETGEPIGLINCFTLVTSLFVREDRHDEVTDIIDMYAKYNNQLDVIIIKKEEEVM